MLTTVDKVGFPHRREIVTIVLAIVTLFISASSVSYSTNNGVVTSFSYFDIAKVALGGILAVLTFRNIVFINEGEAKYKTIRIVLTVVLFAAAAYHIATGLGLLIDKQAYVNALR